MFYSLFLCLNSNRVSAVRWRGAFQIVRGRTCAEASCQLWNIQEVMHGLGLWLSNRIVARLRHSLRRRKESSKFKASIRGQRNFSKRWIISADSVRTSNVKDHAQSDQHAHAAAKKRVRKSCRLGGRFICIPLLSKLPAEERGKLRKKFDIYSLFSLP